MLPLGKDTEDNFSEPDGRPSSDTKSINALVFSSQLPEPWGK